MTPLSQKYIKDVGLCKRKRRNKRCIPKDGMPHASACQKKRIKNAYPKKVCHMLRHVTQKKDSPLSKKKEKERWCIQGSPYTIHQKYPHTCTSWSRFMTCFSFGSGLWLSKIWEAGMPSNPPYLQLHKKKAIRDRLRKKGTVQSLGEELYTLSDPRDHPRNFINFFWKNFTKPLDWQLN